MPRKNDTKNIYDSNIYFLKKGTKGTSGVSGYYILFGSWPQTIKSNDIEILQNRYFTINGWRCYLGSDDNYYVKSKIYSSYDNMCFSNGEPLIKNQVKYFKLEKIKWRILQEYNNKLLLFSENILNTCPFNKIKRPPLNRIINNRTVYDNDYEYSTLRAYLNGLDGSLYNIENFFNKGFIDRAFSKEEKENILTTVVNNKGSSTSSQSEYNKFYSTYTSENTNDKVFPLSVNEITDPLYGFSTNKKVIKDEIDSSNHKRIRLPTDYALANSSLLNSYWLRTSSNCNGEAACSVTETGSLISYTVNYLKFIGIVPAIYIKK